MASAAKVARRFMEKTARVTKIEKRPDGWWFIPEYFAFGLKDPVPLSNILRAYGAKFTTDTVQLWGHFMTSYDDVNMDMAEADEGYTPTFDPPHFYTSLNRFFLTRALALAYGQKDRRVVLVAPVTLRIAEVQPDNQFKKTLVFRDLVASKWSQPRTPIPATDLKNGIAISH